MEKISILSALLLSLPEALFGVFFTFLLVFEQDVLPLKCDKEKKVIYWIKYISTVFIMVATIVILKSIITDMLLVLIVQLICIGVIFKIIYNFSIKKSFLAAFIYLFHIVMIESIYMSSLINCIAPSLKDYFNSPLYLRFLCSLIARVIQIELIVSFWNWGSAFLTLKAYNVKKSMFLSFFIIIAFVEITTYVMYFSIFHLLNLPFRMFSGMVCILMGVLNVMAYMIYFKYVKAVKY